MEVPEEDRFYFLFRPGAKESEDDEFGRVALRRGLGARHSQDIQDVGVEPGHLEEEIARVSSDETYSAPSFYTTRSSAEEKRQEKRASGDWPSVEGYAGMVRRWVDRESLIEAVEQQRNPGWKYMMLDDEILSPEELLERLRA